MNDGFGIESPARHDPGRLRRAVRHVVVIDAGGSAVARLYSDTRELLAEFDAGAEETASLIAGVPVQHGALGSDWDRALAGHGAEERAAAEVYHLSV